MTQIHNSISEINGGELSPASGFSSLDKAKQVLVFQTIQEGIAASPPRPEATFERVVPAYLALEEVVQRAAQGELTDHDLACLEHNVDAAGGVIAPGLHSQGEKSLAAFRASTFGLLTRNFSPPVVAAACQALNASLASHAFSDLNRVFQAMAAFFAPLTPSSGNTEVLESFHELDLNRQCLVFETLRGALAAKPQRTDATFAAVVSAFQAERAVLQAAADGCLSDKHLLRLELSIEAAGGEISPNVLAHGRSSVAAFRAATFKALQPQLPAEVYEAALFSLNARLRELRAQDLGTLFAAVETFFSPLLNDAWDGSTVKCFRGLDGRSQSLVFNTIELALAGQPELEPEIFASAVSAYACEQALVEAAAAGKLGREVVENFYRSIVRCGGVIAPGIRAQGPGSVGQFLETCFVTVQRALSAEVYQAALTALNVKLKTSAPIGLDAVISVTEAFMAPLHASRVLEAAPQPDALLLSPEQGDSGNHSNDLELPVEVQEPAVELSSAAEAPLEPAEAEPEPQPEPQPAPVVDQSPVDEGGVDEGAVADPAPDASADPEPQPEPEPEPQPEPEPIVASSVVEECSAEEGSAEAQDASSGEQPDDAPVAASEPEPEPEAAPAREAADQIVASMFMADTDTDEEEEEHDDDQDPPSGGSSGGSASSDEPEPAEDKKSSFFNFFFKFQSLISSPDDASHVDGGRLRAQASPALYLIAYNLLLFGVPLALVRSQMMAGAPELPEGSLPATLQDAGASPIALNVAPEVQPASVIGQPAIAQPLVVPRPQPAAVASGQPAPVDPAPLGAPPVNLLRQLKWADGLGGPITLQSLKEPLMPVAARAERLQQERSGDPLGLLPLHWRDALRKELPSGTSVSDAVVVRLPVPALQQREEVPVIVDEHGQGEGLVSPSDQRVRDAVERWAARQAPAAPGTVQVFLIAAEPVGSSRP